MLTGDRKRCASILLRVPRVGALAAVALACLGLASAEPAFSGWQTFNTGNGLVGNSVNTIFEDRSGNLWFGTYGYGMSRYDGATWRTFTTADGLASNDVFSIVEDHAGKGGFADREVGIGFTLGQASTVTVRVYSRAGWLVREVASGVALTPGANLVRWDGRDRAGAVVTDGLYLVTVEALGHTQTKTLAVVR